MSRKLTIEDCRNMAIERGVLCLSEEYANSQTKMLWECNKSHQWDATYNSIQQGRSCPNCYGNKHKTIEDCHKLAAAKNGKCLSIEYVNSRTKMLWECEFGHKWEVRYKNIQEGHWCPECNKNTIQDCQAAAYIKNGKCLSLEYVNNRTKMLWECNLGHQWESVYSSVQQGHWCPECVGLKRKTLQDCRILADSRDGKCLSTEYIGAFSKLLWECSNKHQWESCYNNIQQGQWCPECAFVGQSQKLLESVLISMVGLGKILINYKKINWLRNPETNRNLELDFYFPEIKLAIEYDGIQHFKSCRFGGSSIENAQEAFESTKERDKLKNKLISEHPEDIKYFIRIPYWEKLTRENIERILLSNGISV